MPSTIVWKSPLSLRIGVMGFSLLERQNTDLFIWKYNSLKLNNGTNKGVRTYAVLKKGGLNMAFGAGLAGGAGCGGVGAGIAIVVVIILLLIALGIVF